MNECCRHRIRTVQCSQHIVFLVPRAALEESVQKPFGEEKSKKKLMVKSKRFARFPIESIEMVGLEM